MNIHTNRKAFRDYEILEKFECGIELKGSEVKSLRDGRITLEDSFARIEDGEVILYHVHINTYEQASYLNVEIDRPRRLLLHKHQIRKLAASVSQKGTTLVALKAYFNTRGYAKIELALCRGKKLHDRRDDIKKREGDKALRRMLKNRRK
jgi:SsrA-binding protein